jgi:hypothetical protein
MSTKPDPVMERVRVLVATSGLSMEELGRRMGYKGTTAGLPFLGATLGGFEGFLACSVAIVFQ